LGLKDETEAEWRWGVCYAKVSFFAEGAGGRFGGEKLSIAGYSGS
jgi:hypothetical protein